MKVSGGFTPKQLELIKKGQGITGESRAFDLDEKRVLLNTGRSCR